MNKYQHSQWEDLIGVLVEIQQNGKIVCTGFVDEAMPDGSAIWVAPDGSRTRRIFEKSEGFQVYVKPQPLTGALTYRMTLEQLYPQTADPASAHRQATNTWR